MNARCNRMRARGNKQHQGFPLCHSQVWSNVVDCGGSIDGGGDGEDSKGAVWLLLRQQG